MEFTDLESSNIAAAAYESNKLYVKFKNGSIYSYEGVSKSVFRELCEASSVGKYFAAHIKNNYSFVKEG